MRAGQLVGGKVATPIREMLSSDTYNSVIFHCDDARKAEHTRTAALLLRARNRYRYRTLRDGSDLIVYQEEGAYDPVMIHVDIREEEGIRD